MARALRLQPPLDADLEAGHRALSNNNWPEARTRFESALAHLQTGEAHRGLGTALLSLGDIPGALRHLESAFRLFRESGDRRSAARVAVMLGLEYAGTRGEDAVGRGWLARARRCLEGVPDSPEHAWLEVWEGHVAFLIHDDIETGRRHLARAVELAGALELPDVEVFAVGLEGLALVAEGAFDEGLRRLDEATTAAVSGELDDLQASGQACCYVMKACEQVRDFERAAQWLERSKELARRRRLGVSLSYCRLHLATLLTWRGSWREAEAELATMTEEIGELAPSAVPEILARRGELCRLQGRLEEAGELFERAGSCPLAALGLAALALDRGDPARCGEWVERYFRRLPRGDRVQRAPGWVLLARAATRLGRNGDAAAAVAALNELALSVGTEEMRATALAAEGLLLVARGELVAGQRALEDAIDLFEHAGAPYEGGRARIDLAETLLAQGRPEAAAEEAGRARRQLEALGASTELARAGAVLRSTAAATGDDEGAALLTARQREVLALVARGLANREIGERLFVSEHTVKRHVADILTRLDLPSRAAATAWAVRHGID